MTEVWKSLPDNLKLSRYNVSNLGRIKNIQTNILKCAKNAYGYVSKNLVTDEGISKKYHLHRLIAFTFIDNPEKYKIVDHINRVRDDNRTINLRWVTHKQNCKNRKKYTRGTSRPIYQYDMDNNLIKEWPSIKEAASNVKCVSRSGIRQACAGIISRHKEWKWKYKDWKIIQGEEWRRLSINGEDYNISDHGRIKLKSGRISYGHKSVAGYMTIGLDITRTVHRVVMMAFKSIKNSDNYQVNHMDKK